jgi:hypothetical protein
MKKIALTVLGLVTTFSVAIAATGSLLDRAQQAPAAVQVALSPAQEPVSLSGALIAAAVLAIGFLATRRRGD